MDVLAQRVLAVIYVLLAASVSYASGRIEKITTLDQFGYFSNAYYLEPRPDLIESAIVFMGSPEFVVKPSAHAPVRMFFSCLFSNHDVAKKETWKNAIQQLNDPEKSWLAESFNKKPSMLLDATPLSPAKNDMHWACFFATGDIRYVDSIISALDHLDDREDINLFMTAASAKWSLASDSKRHPKVKAGVESVRAGGAPEIRMVAREILEKEPSAISEEIVDVLRG